MAVQLVGRVVTVARRKDFYLWDACKFAAEHLGFVLCLAVAKDSDALSRLAERTLVKFLREPCAERSLARSANPETSDYV